MNTLFNISKRSFAAVHANPRVVLQISKAGQSVGDLVFELYADKQPNTAENFINLATANDGASLKGTHFHHGIPGFGITGG